MGKSHLGRTPKKPVNCLSSGFFKVPIKSPLTIQVEKNDMSSSPRLQVHLLSQVNNNEKVIEFIDSFPTQKKKKNKVNRQLRSCFNETFQISFRIIVNFFSNHWKLFETYYSSLVNISFKGIIERWYIYLCDRNYSFSPHSINQKLGHFGDPIGVNWQITMWVHVNHFLATTSRFLITRPAR